MDIHIKGGPLDRAKANGFAEFLQQEHPDLLEGLIIPAKHIICHASRNRDQAALALNLAIDFINSLETLPRVSKNVVHEVSAELQREPDRFCAREIERAANNDSSAVQAWGNQVVAAQVKAMLVLEDNEPLLRELDRLFIGVFACFRRSLEK